MQTSEAPMGIQDILLGVLVVAAWVGSLLWVFVFRDRRRSSVKRRR